MATRGHFVFPIDAKNHRVHVIWDLNGYGEYEFDRCIATHFGDIIIIYRIMVQFIDINYGAYLPKFNVGEPFM